MKTKLLLIVAAALMITSCSKESVVDSDVDNATNAISFTSYKNVTKGNPIDDNSEFQKEGRSFGVTAFISTSTSPLMGYKTAGAGIKWDVTLNKWAHVKDSESAFWPVNKETVSFHAYSPFDNAAITQAFDKAVGLTLNYTVPELEKDQVDLMFAENRGLNNAGVSKPETGNAVNLPFKHALTQVHFGIATKTDRLKIDVAKDGIIINRIMSKGTFAAATAVWSAWDNSISFAVTSDAITAGYGVEATADVPAHKYAKVGSDDKALMLLPQTFAATTITNGAEGSYLTINCKIYQMLADGITKVYLHGSENEFVVINVPISSVGIVKDTPAEVWLRNNKVTYNLLIGAGGAGGLDPIEFTTEVEKWLDANGGVFENK